MLEKKMVILFGKKCEYNYSYIHLMKIEYNL